MFIVLNHETTHPSGLAEPPLTRAPGAPAARAARRSRPRPRGADVLRAPDAVAAGAALRDDVDGQAGEDPGTGRKNMGTPITTMWGPPGYILVYKP